MSSTVENSIESLQLLVNERDATIALLKSRATSYVEKLKAEHTDSLTQEQTARQQLQVSKYFDKLGYIPSLLVNYLIYVSRTDRTSWKQRNRFSFVLKTRRQR